MKADHAQVNRLLKTARGQIDGILKMVEEDRYCLDVSSQIMAAQSILKKANRMVLRAHMDCCVREAAASGDPDAKLEELAALLDKLAEQVFEVRDGEVLRYSGNWSDWKAKRKEEEAPAKAEKPKAAQERPRERKLKFSFKEQREFETIDEDLAALEQQIRECEEAQGACGSDYVKLQELQAKQAELEAALEEKTERWMYLTELKEKIDAQ